MTVGSAPSSQTHKFVSFDGSTKQDARLIRPSQPDFFRKENIPHAAISRGAGLSYAAASFGANVVSIEHELLDRIIDFDEREQWIELEAGASLGKLYDFVIGKNLFLATQPGHPRISVGGCIAADIHGKNQFMDGTFMNQVVSLKLFHPAHGIIDLSPDSNEDLFRLTCGAYGLTGNIISCKLRLKRIPSSYADVALKPLSSIEDLIPQLKESARVSDFVLSWHDFTLGGKNFGKGFVQEGRFRKAVEDGSQLQSGGSASLPGRSWTAPTVSPGIFAKQTKKAAEQSLDSDSRGCFIVPVFNPLSIKLMNMLFGARCRNGGSSFSMSLFDSIFPIQNSKELYFKFFGEAGFHEYQVVVPEANFPEYSAGVKDYLSKSHIPITLASAKLFAGKQDLLRFTGDGICFALNFSRSERSCEFLSYLDKLLLKCGGIPNIIKDSRLSAESVAACYPEYEKFRSLLREFDPKRIYKSELSERLAL